ncbi:hypothetical protein XELAEV_18027081mg [Xenopus laevis]|uniref:Uncharacterized protein n=1 Tax=Xenopus laevis TaxID=8355 RepID=A0A974CVK8_XENLA|nr:hypothetical protein XELAEV_18027081mg [Xenopus laevis]
MPRLLTHTTASLQPLPQCHSICTLTDLMAHLVAVMEKIFHQIWLESNVPLLSRVLAVLSRQVKLSCCISGLPL